jgi:hypothetical protein
LRIRDPRLPALIGAALSALSLGAVSAAPALASGTQQAMLEDDLQLTANPQGTVDRLRMIGVGRIRLGFRWFNVAPNPFSSRPPKGFNGANPASYDAAKWAPYDQIIIDATRAGIGIDLDAMGGAPAWALGPGRPKGSTSAYWEPSPVQYQAFVHALAVRYSGKYTPPGASSPLPRVSFWSIWNEPDYGPSLAPQGVPGHLTIENSPRMYRQLVDSAWSALHQTGHGRDTFIFGELAPRGYNYWGQFSGMRPLVFLRAMYCVDSSYHPLTGSPAKLRGCPTTPAGVRRFRSQHPAMFRATGISDHPYMRWYAPNKELSPDPANGSSTVDYSSLALLGNLEHAIDRLQRVYGSPSRMSIWNTEFAYITTPPKHDNQYEPQKPHHFPWVTQTTAAYYDNWAEYLSWRDPRIGSFFQYLLHDPLPATKATDWGGYASGLLAYNYSQKATYAAWRMPLYLPKTTARRGQSLEVWGCLRPAHYAILDTSQAQTVAIQFQPNSRSPWQTVQSVTISRPNQSCYFDVRVRFPSTGNVRLGWSYPTQDPELGYFDPLEPHSVVSRSQSIKLR